jgi:C4-dicarboxylate-specific signal transduction histidine kinase
VAHTEKIIREGADTFETKHRTKTGEIRDVLVISRGVSIGGRDFALAIWRDMTEAKRAEEEARRREAELAHVSRLSLVGEMASGLSHELNQPLSTILFYARGCIRRIQSGTLAPAALLDVLEKVAVQADAAGRIVRRLREFVSKRAPHLSTVDVNETIRRALSFAEAETTRSGARVRLQLAEALPAVRADRIQLEQVIVNLVRNGVEAMQAVELGQRELAIETARSADNTITVGVHDTGVGLSAEIAERVFDSFFSTKPDGMGMGLSISRSIIEAHGGRLWVTPDSERGTTFRFSLPVMRGAADEDA